LQRADRAALKRVLQCLLADTGVVEPPESGCAVRTGEPSRDRIEQIVIEVMETLRRRGMIE